MKIVVAPDSFKGSIGAADAARALADGWRSVRPGDDIVLLPMADGGEGTLEAFALAVTGATRMPVTVTEPDGAPHEAAWVLVPDGTGVVELASTCGIELLGDARAPWDASTRGFGEAIRAALAHGVRALVLGVGSSASTDGGVGMLGALGGRIQDASGAPVALGARGLAHVARADLTHLAPAPVGGIRVLCDVTNPLLGERGAAAVFGPQKGLVGDDILRVDAALAAYARLLPADPETPGAGAAGGAGFALLAWGAELVPGSAAVADLVGLPQALADADLVITGEGSFDGQSASGKAPAEVARRAQLAGAPVALVAGRVDADTSAFACVVELGTLAGSADVSFADPHRWMREAGAELARRIR